MHSHSPVEHIHALRVTGIAALIDILADRQNERFELRSFGFASIERLGAAPRDLRCIFARQWIALEFIERFA